MDIHALLAKMTLEEKLAQMSQYVSSCLASGMAADVTGPNAYLGLTDEEIASVGSCLGTNKSSEMLALQKKHLVDDPHKIPLLFMRDVIHGYRTVYPVPLGMAAAWDEELLCDCCRMAAKESAVSGIHVTFSPMVDLVRDCRWGRNMESTGEDPWYNGRLARAMVRGYQGDMTDKYDIAACVKHFAAYGAAESGRDYNTTDISDHSMKEYYLPAYRAAVDAGVRMVMTSFNALNGIPSSGNTKLVQGVLRDEWGFDGLVISDWNAFTEMKAHGYIETDREAAEAAITAGTDIEMMSSCYLHHMKALIEEGKASVKQVDEAVLRILQLKEELGLFDNPFRAASAEEEAKYCLCAEHRALARRAAREAAVLLKNDGVLPFSEKEIKTLAVIGPYADCGMIGSWACAGTPEEAVSVAEGLRRALPGAKVTVSAGCSGDLHAKPDAAQEAAAVAAAQEADAVVLCLGEDAGMSGEGNSRADVCLPEAQKSLIRAVVTANPKTAVLLFCGRPLALGDIVEDAPAFFTMWQPGTEGGSAAADLLLGHANFGGHLTMSFPYHVGQAPIYYNRMRTGRPKPFEESQVGYVSRYIDCPNRPLFPFGYGLSYTAFAYGEPVLDAAVMKPGTQLTASVTVKNTGDMAGTTTVQFYIHDCVASLVRPVRELRGYQKIMLAPGEEKTVSFPIDEETLSFDRADGTYGAERGKFEVFLSPDAESGTPATFVYDL